jgi:hypothetical protein
MNNLPSKYKPKIPDIKTLRINGGVGPTGEQGARGESIRQQKAPRLRGFLLNKQEQFRG